MSGIANTADKLKNPVDPNTYTRRKPGYRTKSVDKNKRNR